jgi:hypothetical protein
MNINTSADKMAFVLAYLVFYTKAEIVAGITKVLIIELGIRCRPI